MTPTLERDGIVVCERVVPGHAVSSLRNHFALVAATGPGGRTFEIPSFIQKIIGQDGPMGLLAASLVPKPVKPVRILFFDKTPESNWAVPWHQDRTIAVKARHEVDGYGPWSSKGDVLHVEPPVAILEGMLTLRLFVDDCGIENGPLEVAKGSHRLGRVPASEAKEIAQQSEIFIGTGWSGDVLAMKVLALHRSKRAVRPAHRRVFHVDYATEPLPSPLDWAIP